MTTSEDWWSWLRQRVETPSERPDEHGHVMYAIRSHHAETFWKVTAKAADDTSEASFAGHSSRVSALASIPALQADPENARYDQWGIRRYETWVLVVDENGPSATQPKASPREERP